METLWLVVGTRNNVRIGHGTGSPAVNTKSRGYICMLKLPEVSKAEGDAFVPYLAMLSIPCSREFGTYIGIDFLSQTQFLVFSSSFPA